MPDDKRQLNFKLDAETARLWERVLKRAQKELGFELSQGQLVGLALKALEREYDRPAEGEGK